MPFLEAFFFQYHVNIGKQSSAGENKQKGLATIIVFAENQEVAVARSSRIVSAKNLEITCFVRSQVLCRQHQRMFDSVLKTLYSQAELYGVALHCDHFPAGASCCHKNSNPY